MDLPHRKETTIYVDSFDLDKFVSNHYGVKFNFVAKEEATNDSEHAFTVNGRVDDFEEEEFEPWVKGERNWISTYAILNDLARKGLIEKGSYIIEVCW